MDLSEVRVEGALPFPAARVWAALKVPQEWWAREARVEFKKGGRYETLQAGGWLRGKITSLSNGRKLAVAIPFDTPNVSVETTLTISLKTDGQKTRVAFAHAGPDVMAWTGELRNLEKGWRETLVKLSNYLKGSR